MNFVSNLPVNNTGKRNSQRYRTTSFSTAGLEKYESVLYKIATNFDFEDNEVYDLMRQVRLHINSNCLKSRSIGLKIWCSKIMVHKCIFIISQKLFSQHTLRINPVFYAILQTLEVHHAPISVNCL